MCHGFNDTFAGTNIRLESVALLRIDLSQCITRCCLQIAFIKTANGFTHDTWAPGGFLLRSQRSRYLPSCSYNDQEGFMLAYHVWMDDGTKMIGAQVTAGF